MIKLVEQRVLFTEPLKALHNPVSLTFIFGISPALDFGISLTAEWHHVQRNLSPSFKPRSRTSSNAQVIQTDYRIITTMTPTARLDPGIAITISYSLGRKSPMMVAKNP